MAEIQKEPVEYCLELHCEMSVVVILVPPRLLGGSTEIINVKVLCELYKMTCRDVVGVVSSKAFEMTC